jgi:bacterioferritin-associated ferredoxin
MSCDRRSFERRFAVIVCLCHGVDDAQIEDLIAEGCESVPSIGKACGAGTDCGSCRGQIEDIIETVTESSPACARRHLRVA